MAFSQIPFARKAIAVLHLGDLGADLLYRSLLMRAFRILDNAPLPQAEEEFGQRLPVVEGSGHRTIASWDWDLIKK